MNLVKKRAKGLTAKDGKASLARVRLALDFPPPQVAGPGPEAPTQTRTRKMPSKGRDMTLLADESTAVTTE